MTRQAEKLSKSTRFGIIGAGASGLTIAYFLKQKGYENITILEKGSQAGGKCFSFAEGDYQYDLGAIFLGPKYFYQEVSAIAKQLNIKRIPAPTDRIVCDLTGQPINLIEKQEIVRFLWEILKFKFLQFQKKFDPVKLEELSELYSEPCSSFLTKYGLVTLEKFLIIPTTSFGYGYLTEVPAAYLLWYLSACLFPALRQQFDLVPSGVASIWEKLAEQHTVKCNQRILQIERTETVKVVTQADTYEFDKLIIACPLDKALEFLDSSPEEQDLFTKIQYYDYYNFLFPIDNLPSFSRCYFPANMNRSRHGHLLVWARKYSERNLYLAYAFGHPGQSPQDVEGVVREDLAQLGAIVGETLSSAYRKYFPHVSSHDMQAGFYTRLEALQGELHTYFGGEICTFSLLEAVTRYSKHLVNRFF